MTCITLSSGKFTVSISLVSDIVLDVARAADPLKSRVAAEKLSRGEAANQAPRIGFDRMLTSAAGPLPAARKIFASDGPNSSGMLPRIDAKTKAYKGLEQLILKNLMESMLPKESAAIFGKGSAGDIWRSFLADQLAAEIVKTVDLGIVHQPSAAPYSRASGALLPARHQMSTQSGS